MSSKNSKTRAPKLILFADNLPPLNYGELSELVSSKNHGDMLVGNEGKEEYRQLTKDIDATINDNDRTSKFLKTLDTLFPGKDDPELNNVDEQVNLINKLAKIKGYSVRVIRVNREVEPIHMLLMSLNGEDTYSKTYHFGKFLKLTKNGKKPLDKLQLIIDEKNRRRLGNKSMENTFAEAFMILFVKNKYKAKQIERHLELIPLRMELMPKKQKIMKSFHGLVNVAFGAKLFY